MTDPNRRRVPPRGNPEPGAQPQQAYVPAVAIPWWQIVLTTAVTTLTGYLTIELIKAGHRSVVERRKAKQDAALTANTKPVFAPAGIQADGSFRLPTPDNIGMPANPLGRPMGPVSNGPQPGYAPTYQAAPQQAAPPLVDVNAPGGQFRHELHQMQRAFDGRLANLERILMASHGASHGAPAQGGGWPQHQGGEEAA